ncbi:MAG: hypothetical protein V1726_04280 [Methanobacteriota archaeon]
MKKNEGELKTIKVAILAEEPFFWSSLKHYFPIILNDFFWEIQNITYKISASYIYDRDILKGNLTTSAYDVLLIPGGGVGDSESMVKGFNSLRKVKKWKKKIQEFVQAGGGCIGICGGAALITNLCTESKKTTTFMERQYDKSSIGISGVMSYYKDVAFILFYPFQRKHPEKIGASFYVFSFAPGETTDGIRIHTGGVPLDFQICKDNPIFSDFPDKTLRMRWLAGQALLVPENPDREVTILARYPENDISENESTRIHAWSYTGGIHGFFIALLKAFRLAKVEHINLKHVLMHAFFLAGDWKLTDKVVELDHANKPCMTAEIYPNENRARIILCAPHPQYMIWWGGHIEEVDDTGFNCLGTGLHQWKDIDPLSKNAKKELTYTWWVLRRLVAWAAKVPDSHLPPIDITEEFEEKFSVLYNNIFWDGTLIGQMNSI